MRMTETELNVLLSPLGLQLGDYCHVHRWPDSDPCDPWSVGHLCAVEISKSGIYFKVSGDGCLDRWFPCCEKITAEQGAELLARDRR